MKKSTCIEADCGSPIRCKGRCRNHYAKWRYHTPAAERPVPTFRERFLAKVQVDENGCWIWQGYIGPKGYGQVRGKGRTQPAHQAAYQEWKGEIPTGMEPDHLCKVRSCVNPDHLEAVTHRENLLRSSGIAARNARKTHCPQGHPYAGDNLITVARRSGQGRQCRTCRDARNRARHN